MTRITWIYNISLNEKTRQCSCVDKLILYKIASAQMTYSTWHILYSKSELSQFISLKGDAVKCTDGGFYGLIPEQRNHACMACAYSTCGDWPLLLGFVFAEQFLQASVLEALRMWCRSSYCDHIIEGICGGNSKHPSTGLTNHKQAPGARFTSIFHRFMCFLLFCEYIQTACPSWRTVMHLLNRV